MFSLFAVLIISVTLSLLLTPAVGRLGFRLGAVDLPSARKIHSVPMPRVGGVAIFVAFTLTLPVASILPSQAGEYINWDQYYWMMAFGGWLVFSVGLIDDFHRLNPWLKLAVQIVAASVAWWGGIRIDGSSIFGFSIAFNPLVSYCITVLWFLLFINAINLIDGLDGLAAGICLFVTFMMTFISFIFQNYPMALLFAAPTGSLIGFLRYNFNPASIFLGDGGSYFLGYALAALAIVGSVKSQVGAMLLIPMVALGVPIMDTMLSTLRRFILGKSPFQPDKDHLHHRLLSLGLSMKQCVYVLYGITFVLCFAAILLVHLRDTYAGFVIMLIAFGAVIFIRKMGYVHNVNLGQLRWWLNEISDSIGISHDRRQFFNYQYLLGSALSMDELWGHVETMVGHLKFDYAGLYLNSNGNQNHRGEHPEQISERRQRARLRTTRVSLRNSDPTYEWYRNGLEEQGKVSHRLLSVEFPLNYRDDHCQGILLLVKDLQHEPLHPHAMRHIERMVRSMDGMIVQLTDFDSVIDCFNDKNSNGRLMQV